MNIHIFGASTLRNFTNAIRSGFAHLGVSSDFNKAADFTLVQIHGSPKTLDEDCSLIELARTLEGPRAFLIHRPDEILLRPTLKCYFETNPQEKLIFLGDLIFKYRFWANRRKFSTVIPHPQLEFSFPKRTQKLIVGSYTSWDEMRDVRHYIALTEHLKCYRIFEFRVGGSGLNVSDIPDHIQYRKDLFVPHFNVQLYNLLGKKRYGESSGSIHRGICVPVIFEANGAERLECLRVVKVKADDELKKIDYEKAVAEIVRIAEAGVYDVLEANKMAAETNSVRSFAAQVMKFVAT